METCPQTAEVQASDGKNSKNPTCLNDYFSLILELFINLMMTFNSLEPYSFPVYDLYWKYSASSEKSSLKQAK